MIFDWLYPRRCPVCEDIVMPKGELVCDECRSRIPYIHSPRCCRCGKELADERQEFCYDCTRKTFYYECGAAPLRYNAVMRRAMEGLKYRNKREYADFFAEEILRAYGNMLKSWQPDMLIPVPIHSARRRSRGYNQAELLAEPFGERLGVPVRNDILIRSRSTGPQNKLNDKERRKNVEEAFQIKENGVQLKRVILVDDIYTTGSTVNACAKVLKEAGAGTVYFICACIGNGY